MTDPCWLNLGSNLQKSLDKPYTMASSTLYLSRGIGNSLRNMLARRVTLESATKFPGSSPNVDFYRRKLTNVAPDGDTNDEARPQLQMLVEMARNTDSRLNHKIFAQKYSQIGSTRRMSLRALRFNQLSDYAYGKP